MTTDSARSVQKGSKGWDDAISDEIVYRAKLLDNRPAFGPSLSATVKVAFAIGFILPCAPLVDAAEAAEHVVVLYPAGRVKGEHLETGIVPAIDLDGLTHWRRRGPALGACRCGQDRGEGRRPLGKITLVKLCNNSLGGFGPAVGAGSQHLGPESVYAD